MADNVPITAGSGTTIATDDVGGFHYQLIKLAHGALDTATLVSSVEGLPVTEERPATATLANVAASITVVTLQASNVNRMGWMVYNDSTSAMWLKLGAAASATSFTVNLGPGAYYELPTPCFTGQITGIWVAANGNARVTETTA